jgi:hypothetical protein
MKKTMVKEESEIGSKLAAAADRRRDKVVFSLGERRKKILAMGLTVEVPTNPTDIRNRCLYFYEHPWCVDIRRELDSFIRDVWSRLRASGIRDQRAMDNLRDLVLSGQAIVIQHFDEGRVAGSNIKRSFYHHCVFRREYHDDFGTPKLAAHLADLCYLEAVLRKMEELRLNGQDDGEVYGGLEIQATKMADEILAVMKKPLMGMSLSARLREVNRYFREIQGAWARLAKFAALPAQALKTTPEPVEESAQEETPVITEPALMEESAEPLQV